MASSINASTSAGVITTADTSGILQLQTAGTTAVTIDASQNAGLGVTPSAWNSAAKALQYSTSGSLWAVGGQSRIGNNHYYDATGTFRYLLSGAIASDFSQTSGGFSWSIAPSGTAGNAVTFTTSMALDASGNLGLGLTAASGVKLHIGDPDPIIRLQANTASGVHYAKIQYCTPAGVNVGEIGLSPYGGNATLFQSVAAGWNFNWQINSTAVMTLLTSGLLQIPAAYSTTTGSAANLFIDAAGGFYRSTSSLKYKTDVQDATHGLAEVMQLRAVTYKGTGEFDGEKVFGGLIAEEVHEAGLTEFVQYAEDGTPDALAYGHMVSLCIKAIQEQQALIQTLTDRITALENK